MIWGGDIRNEFARDDLGELGALTKCEGVSLICVTPIAADFYSISIWIILRKWRYVNFRELAAMRIIGGALSSIMFSGWLLLCLFF